jgi:DoxX-like family
MNILLWVLQALLAAAFFAHGLLLLVPPADIAAQMTAELPRWFWVFLGVAEIAAAIGITLPGATRILPQLVPAAAAGIMFVMVSATIWHVMRGEISSAFVTLLLLMMATFVAYMRWRVHPIAARSAVVSRA